MSEQASAKGWHIARVTIEAASPISCGAGQGLVADNAIVRDANRLPMIPGTTLQGLLRAAYTGDDEDTLFGCAKYSGGIAEDEKGNEPMASNKLVIKAAKLIFSNAIVHNSENAVSQFMHADFDDVLLKRLAKDAPLTRDHVRLDHRHTAAKGGKFDRAAVPAGTRFSFELMMFGAVDEAAKLDAVLSGLKNPTFRIGSSGNRGYGKVKADGVVAKRRHFPLSEAVAFRESRETPLSAVDALSQNCELTSTINPLTITLKLTPINPWRTGQDGARMMTNKERQKNRDGGENSCGDPRKKDANLAPMRESKIEWSSGAGQWIEPHANNKKGYLLPASSLRGPLAHRALFHWNAQNKHFIDADNVETVKAELNAFLANKAELNSLFGDARDDGTGGQASAVIFDDIAIKVTKIIDVDHIKIDRFTGGVIQGALYSEELLAPETLECVIRVHPNRREAICATSRKAFLAALRDLAEGRLALGAKSYGFCKGEGVSFEGEDKVTWKAAYDATKREAVT